MTVCDKFDYYCQMTTADGLLINKHTVKSARMSQEQKLCVGDTVNRRCAGRHIREVAL